MFATGYALCTFGSSMVNWARLQLKMTANTNQMFLWKASAFVDYSFCCKLFQLPVMEAIRVVKAPADQIFNLIMDYGSERQQ